MKLTKFEIEAIKRSFKEGKIYLFGSRVDDTQKGGDIDLYIVSDKKENLSEKKIELRFR